MDIIVMYIAVVFFCIGNQCGMISVETPYSNKSSCMSDVIKAEEKLKKDPAVSIIEGRCVNFNNGIKL